MGLASVLITWFELLSIPDPHRLRSFRDARTVATMLHDATAYRPPASPERFAGISRPTLIVDRARVRANLRRMRAKADASGTRFRPHVKSHNSPRIAALYREVGVAAVTVASVEMARRFADAGWNDITVAFPLNVRAMFELQRLAADIQLGLLVDSPEAAAALGEIVSPVDVWLDIDVGYGRTGVPWDDRDALVELLGAVRHSDRHRVRGVLTHAGHAYHVPDVAARAALWTEVAERMAAARDTLDALGSSPALEISVGDTPTCSVVSSFDGADEARPGNFVLNDLQQHALRACSSGDLALVVACPVVGVYPRRGELVVQGGAVHLSRDVAPGPDGQPGHGQLAVVGQTSWDLLPASEAYVRGLSQEHGMIRCTREVLDQVRVGDLVFIVPAHVCLAANLIGEFVFLDEPGAPFRD
jgi:D-serine deaminase-like pyridoxal phosphate-dependent protein